MSGSDAAAASLLQFYSQQQQIAHLLQQQRLSRAREAERSAELQKKQREKREEQQQHQRHPSENHSVCNNDNKSPTSNKIVNDAIPNNLPALSSISSSEASIPKVSNLDSERLSALASYWTSLMTSQVATDINEETMLQAFNFSGYFESLMIRYSEPHRFYHTPEHLYQLYLLARQFAERLHRPRLVGLAIFFHDAIYNPRISDNERASRALFLEFERQIMLSEQEVYLVCAFIMATIKHDISQFPGLNVEEKSDLAYFLDFDLEVLSWDRPEYQKYTDNIRKEYSFVPDADFRAGRIRILKSFLQKDRIYYTEDFHQLGKESKARANLEWEIDQLEKGL